jgi:hypothetical protein
MVYIGLNRNQIDFKSAASAAFAIRALSLSYPKYLLKKKRTGDEKAVPALAGTARDAIFCG